MSERPSAPYVDNRPELPELPVEGARWSPEGTGILYYGYRLANGFIIPLGATTQVLDFAKVNLLMAILEECRRDGSIERYQEWLLTQP